jgi:proteasome beta subunit
VSDATPGDGLPLEEVTPQASFSALLRCRGLDPRWDVPGGARGVDAPEGTTVLAFRYRHGVVMAGDRRATAGSFIAHRRVQKVYPADGYSAVAISGTAGVAVEMIRLFQTELEHYEKMEGHRLSLEGKANYLAAMVRRQLPMAFQGLAVIPIFCGFDEEAEAGRLFSYDIVGGRYEEIDYTATGSGGRDARLYLRGVFAPDLPEEDAMRIALEALVVAAEEDSATGGPDIRREIYPNVVFVDGEGYREIDSETVGEVAKAVLEEGP